MTSDEDDWQLGWSPDTPGAIESRIGEIRSTIESLDSTSPADMTVFFYMHGFNELDLAVHDLLRIVESLQQRSFEADQSTDSPADAQSPVSEAY